MRPISHHYEDALDRIWITTAERIGFRVVRSDGVYASTDGRGTLIVGSSSTLDADDSLAQMIFHELCHSLVEGHDALRMEDWGLANQDDRHTGREYACLRVQAALSTPLGLRNFFAPTTDHRVTFFDSLDEDPLVPLLDPTSILARAALRRVDQAPWGPHLRTALEATASIVAIAAHFTERSPASLFAAAEPRSPNHRVGFPIARGVTAENNCASCAWFDSDKVLCRQAKKRTRPTDSACERWERPFDCQSCGACCREAYDTVDVGPRDAFIKKHPALIVLRGDGSRGIARSGERCAALAGSIADGFGCTVYDDRPRTCRDFTIGSAHCLDARRRVGLSR